MCFLLGTVTRWPLAFGFRPMRRSAFGPVSFFYCDELTPGVGLPSLFGVRPAYRSAFGPLFLCIQILTLCGICSQCSNLPLASEIMFKASNMSMVSGLATALSDNHVLCYYYYCYYFHYYQ